LKHCACWPCEARGQYHTGKCSGICSSCFVDWGSRTVSGSPDASVDAHGDFRLDSVPPGSYIVEVNDRSHYSGIVACSVVASYGRAQDIGTDTIRPYATLTGSIVLPAGAGSKAFVQVYGLQRLTETDSAGVFVMSDLPPGNFRLRLVAPAAGVGSRDTSNIVAVSGVVSAIAPVALFTFASETTRAGNTPGASRSTPPLAVRTSPKMSRLSAPDPV